MVMTASAHFYILRQTTAQPIQTFCQLLPGMAGHLFCAGVNLDARDDSEIGEGLRERGPIFLLLPDGFVEENRTIQAIIQTWRGDNHFAISAPGLLILGNPGCCEPFVARRGTFIHRQQALVAGDESLRSGSKIMFTHLGTPMQLRFTKMQGGL
jgi:hypothetical protein